MSPESVVRTSRENVLLHMQQLVGAAPQGYGADAYRVGVALRPEPAQVARAEQALMRRGYTPALAGTPGRVRLEAREADGCWSLRFESFMRIGAGLVELTVEQRALLETVLFRLTRSMVESEPSPLLA